MHLAINETSVRMEERYFKHVNNLIFGLFVFFLHFFSSLLFPPTIFVHCKRNRAKTFARAIEKIKGIMQHILYVRTYDATYIPNETTIDILRGL